MAAPTPAAARAVIAGPSATTCSQLVNTLLRMPVLFYNLIAAMFNEDGTITTDFFSLIRSPGEVAMFACEQGDGWLFCNGQEVPKATYPLLYAAIGDTYGAATNPLNFKVPDCKSRFPVMGGSGTAYSLGATGGEDAHVLTTGELATHDHALTDDWTTVDTAITPGAQPLLCQNLTHDAPTGHTNDTGTSTAHENRPPYFALLWYIKT